MKSILLCLAAILSLLTLTACGGGGGSDSGGNNAAVTPTSTYTLNFNSSGNGTLTGTVSQAVAQGAYATTVTAVPATGYHFVNWTEGGTVVSVAAALTVANITQNHNYIAHFAANTSSFTTAVLTINLTGTLPSNSNIAGVAFTLALPANATPVLNGDGTVVSGVIMPSGTFAGGLLTPPVYRAATAGATGTINVVLANAATSGVTQIGEVATITLQLANGITPSAGSFVLSDITIIDATLYGAISGMSAVVADVVLQ